VLCSVDLVVETLITISREVFPYFRYLLPSKRDLQYKFQVNNLAFTFLTFLFHSTESLPNEASSVMTVSLCPTPIPTFRLRNALGLHSVESVDVDDSES
jgi:hypothetical protein